MAVKGEEYGLSHQTNYFAYTWVLEDFSKIVSAYEKPGSKMRSNTFEPGKESVAQIYLSLYPGGKTKEDAEHVSVCVMVNGLHEKVVYEKYTLSMKSDGKVIMCYNCSFRVADFGSNWGFSNFVKRKELLQQLVDDVLVVVLEMTYSLTMVKQRSGAVKDVVERSPVFAADEDLLLALDTGRHSDVRIVVRKTQIPAHRFVLAARSKVFSAMFDDKLMRNSTVMIRIADFDASTVRSMLSFMYSGTVQNLDTPLALELLRAADKYDITGLKSFCSNFLMSQLDQKNVCKVLIGAFTNNAEELLKEGIDYLCDKNNSMDFEKYESMLSDHPKLLVKILAEILKK